MNAFGLRRQSPATPLVVRSESGVALRLPPQSKMAPDEFINDYAIPSRSSDSSHVGRF
jgi:hypothetical protein